MNGPRAAARWWPNSSHDSDDVADLLGRFGDVDGVVRTNSTYVVDTLHDDPRAVGSYSLETLLETLADE